MKPLHFALAWALLGAHVAHAAERYELPNSVPARATASRWLRTADPDESLAMSVTLHLQRVDELAALLAAQQNPESPEYHHWLTPEEFAGRFAPAPADYTAVVDWLQREGFTVQPRVNGARIDFSGRVADVERTFAVRMHHYTHRGRAPLANENPPQLPSELFDAVKTLRLNTFPLAEPLGRIRAAATFVTAMAPPDMYVAYNLQPLLDAGVTGSGQTIAVVARSDFKDSDVTSFEQQFHVPMHTPAKVFPSNNPGIGAPNGVCQGIRDQRQLQTCMGGEEGEVLLDTEWASAMAPGAAVLVDISGADIDSSLLDIVTNHPEAKAITMSFGMCERLDSSDLSLFEHMYAQAAAQGQTVLVATGDDGADGCQDGRGRSVNVLSSDANVTAVGGTALDAGFDTAGNATAYVSESVWNDNGGASGGGPSTLVAKPSYQNAPGVPADGARDQPDVALLASPANSGYFTVVEGSVLVAGGTSVAAPSWGGIVALLNDALHSDGSGSLNPALYTLGRRQYAEGGPPAFHDVSVGNNNLDRVVGYSAGPGYDLCTGLGSPDVAVLAHTLNALNNPPTPTAISTTIPSATPIAIQTATQTPVAGSCIGDCNSDQAVTVDEILTLVNVALGTVDLSACTAADANQDGQITINEILAAVNSALNGCGG